MTKSASAKAALSSEPVTSALSREALLDQQLVDLGVDVADALVDAVLVDVGQHDRHLEAAHEQQRQLAGHQARADDADLVHLARQRLVRRTGRALRALVDQVERVQPGPQYVGHEQFGEPVGLGRVTAVKIVFARQIQQFDGLGGARRRAVRASVHNGLGAGDGVVPRRAAVDLTAYRRDLAVDDLGQPQQRLLEVVRGTEHLVDDAELGRLLDVQHLVLRQGVLDDHRDGGVRADQVRQQLRAAPAREQAEEDLGERDRRGVLRERPVVAGQRQFEPAAHDRAVDEPEGRDLRVGEAAEDVVPGLRDLPRQLRVRHRLDAGKVGADGEDERLAGDRDRGGLGGEGHVQRGIQRHEPLRAEGVGPGVVVPVVERDQRDRLGQAGNLDQPGLRVRDDLVGEGRLGFFSGESHLALPV